MLSNKPGLLFLILFTLLSLCARAQTGSMGDPVFTENFGHGTNLTPVGPPLAFERTRLDPTGSKCPGVDQYGRGQYCIAFTTSNCFDGTWRTLYDNHTPNDTYGYMMIINSSNAPDVVYTNRVNGVGMCPSAKYQFQIWAYNIVDEQPGINYQRPDIEFVVTKADGTPIPTIGTSTGPMASTGNWTPYSVDFFAPADHSDLIITLKNKTTGSDLGNDFVMDDITVRSYGPAIQAGFTTVDNTAPQTQCINSGPATYLLKSDQSAFANPLYQWQLSFNNGPWQNILGKTQKDLALNTEFQHPVPGQYQYRVGVLSSAGASINCQTFSDPLTINVVKNPVFALPPITKVCEGDAVRLMAEEGEFYEWTPPNGPPVQTHYLDVTTHADASIEGLYKVKIMDHGCETTTETTIKVYPQLNAAVDNTDPVTCAGTPILLGASGGLYYKWDHAESLDNDEAQHPMANPAQTTEYHVTISNDGCSVSRTVTVKVLALPVADAGADFTMQETVPAKLHGNVVGGDVSYYWTPTDYMDDPTSKTPTINPPDTRTYTLHVESADCGIVSDEVTVHVLKKITIPNTFTPNGDGTNDIWNIDKLATYPESTLAVYTRSGQEVFKTTGDARHWDGIYNGKPLPVGVYYYVIDLKNNLPLRSGWVTLIR